jgi:diphosphomevalonate decarboxylase
VPLCFTLDAGANVHLLYPNQNIEEVHSFIKKELSPYCQNGQYLFDAVGTGAKKV